MSASTSPTATRRCYACTHGEQWLDAVAPISYSVALEQLHHALRGYKRLSGEVATADSRPRLAAVLWRFLVSARGVCRASRRRRALPSRRRPFPRATASATSIIRCDGSSAARRRRPAPDTSGCSHARTATSRPHEFDAHRFEATRKLDGESILLIDDTWTTGASAQSAAAALKRAGAAPGGGGRDRPPPQPQWHESDRRLRAITGPFDWSQCALCAVRLSPVPSEARPHSGR